MQRPRTSFVLTLLATSLLCAGPAAFAGLPVSKPSQPEVNGHAPKTTEHDTAKNASADVGSSTRTSDKSSTTTNGKSTNKNNEASTAAGSSKTAAHAASTSQKPFKHGKVDGSFDNGELVLTKAPEKNGFHKGEPVVVVVDKGSHFTYIFQKQPDDRVVEVFRASNAVGKADTPTPNGPYLVFDKLKWPSWIPPKSIDPKQKAVQPFNKDRKNPLGVARIGLNKFGVFLHGTNSPQSIRKDASHGCIRHSNQDILKIFSMVDRGTTVIIADHMVGTKLNKKEFSTQKIQKKA